MSTFLRAGEALPVLDAGPISRDRLVRFAEASGDPNPIHLDPEFARRSGHDDVIAHGMLSMAYLARLITTAVPQERLRSLQVRFRATVPVGAAPRCTATVGAADDEVAELELRVVLADATVVATGAAVVDQG